MTKFIILAGEQGSGKTSSIRHFLDKRAKIPYKKMELIVVTRIKKNKNTITIGAVTAGDLASDIDDALRFLTGCPCDVIVCAARVGKTGTSLPLETVGKYIGNQCQRIDISTAQVRPSKITSANNKIADRIWQSL